MKKLILILTAITLLSCEKEEPFKEYKLIVMVQNELVSGSGDSPKGYYFEYMENDSIISKQGKYVGESFWLHWNNTQPLYIKAESKQDCNIRISVYKYREDEKPWVDKVGYKTVKIDR